MQHPNTGKDTHKRPLSEDARIRARSFINEHAGFIENSNVNISKLSSLYMNIERVKNPEHAMTLSLVSEDEFPTCTLDIDLTVADDRFMQAIALGHIFERAANKPQDKSYSFSTNADYDITSGAHRWAQIFASFIMVPEALVKQWNTLPVSVSAQLFRVPVRATSFVKAYDPVDAKDYHARKRAKKAQA